MKKFVSLMVAVMMLCCLTVTAFAGQASASPEANKPAQVTIDDKASVLNAAGDTFQIKLNGVASDEVVTVTVGGKTYALKYNATSDVWESTDATLVAAVAAAAAAAPVALTVTAAPAAGAGANYVIGGNGAGAATTGTAAGVSPQTGETVAVYAVAAVVMAAAAAAFVVKARKA